MKKAVKNIALLFSLTKEERLFLGGILAIAFVGIAARHWHLSHEKADSYQPVGVALTSEDRSE